MQAAVDLNLKWELNTERGSLTKQHADLIRESSELRPGDRIPPARKLASELGVSRGTVTTTVEQLVAEGLLDSKMGSGIYVSADAQWMREDGRRMADTFIAQPPYLPEPDIDLEETCQIDFRPCRPSVREFPLADWRRCIAMVSGATPNPDYGDPRGDERLRTAISSYLRRARGLNASADNVIITNGAVHAMHLVSALYLDEHSQVVVEDPGYPLARQTFEMAGASILTCPVDDDGLCVDALPDDASDIRFVYVTPSHQFPTGSRLSLGRRRALIEWAEARGVIVIEDDYDGEFRFDVPPLAPLAAMENNCVIYCGTFSKTLFPGLRVGFAVAPKPLIDSVARYRQMVEYAPNSIIQSALYKFLDEGLFEKHILRMKRTYAAKRKRLADCLQSNLPFAHLSGLESGLHAVMNFGPRGSAERVSNNAKADGILVPPLSRYRYGASHVGNALVLGYAAPEIGEIERGVELIARSI